MRAGVASGTGVGSWTSGCAGTPARWLGRRDPRQRLPRQETGWIISQKPHLACHCDGGDGRVYLAMETGLRITCEQLVGGDLVGFAGYCVSALIAREKG